MKRNPLLYVALLCSKIGSVLLSVALLVVIALFVHWHVAPAKYQSVQISTQGGAISLYEGRSPLPTPIAARETPTTTARTAYSGQPCEKRQYLNDLTSVSVYVTFLQVVLSITLSLLMVREVNSILKQVSESNVFVRSNAQSFRALGWLCLAMSALNCIRVIATVQNAAVSFNPSLSLLLFMVAAFIMAEIFREGHNLAERDRLTI